MEIIQRNRSNAFRGKGVFRNRPRAYLFHVCVIMINLCGLFSLAVIFYWKVVAVNYLCILFSLYMFVLYMFSILLISDLVMHCQSLKTETGNKGRRRVGQRNQLAVFVLYNIILWIRDEMICFIEI